MHATRGLLLFLELAFKSYVLLQLLILEWEFAHARLVVLVLAKGGTQGLGCATLPIWIPVDTQSRFTTSARLLLPKPALKGRPLVQVMIIVGQGGGAHPERTLLHQLRLARLLALLLVHSTARLHPHLGFKVLV